jgi:hypothetical protein
MNDLPRKLPIWPGSPRASQPRNHVLQRHGPDCAIAAAATITGVSYEEAASVAFSLREKGLGGVRPRAMVELLNRLTDAPWRVQWLFRTRTPLAHMVFPEQLTAACIISRGLLPRAHAIVARGPLIYDGSLDQPVSREQHPCKDWYVNWLIEPDLD